MDNTFEEVNCACCFNHTLQLSAKTLLKLFNVGISLTKLASEEEESEIFDDEMLMLLDDNAEGDEGGDEDGYDGGGGEDLYGDDEPNEASSDKINELNQLDEQEAKKVLMDMAVVRHTITKVRSDPF